MKAEQRFASSLWTLFFWFFLAVKVGGTSLAAWSWWWVLFPPVPVLGLLVSQWGL